MYLTAPHGMPSQLYYHSTVSIVCFRVLGFVGALGEILSINDSVTTFSRLYHVQGSLKVHLCCRHEPLPAQRKSVAATSPLRARSSRSSSAEGPFRAAAAPSDLCLSGLAFRFMQKEGGTQCSLPTGYLPLVIKKAHVMMLLSCPFCCHDRQLYLMLLATPGGRGTAAWDAMVESVTGPGT